MPILDTVGIAKKLKELYSKAITPDYLSSLRSGGPSLELPTPEMGVGQKLYKGALDRLGLNETDQEALNMAMGAVTGGFKPDTTPSSLS